MAVRDAAELHQAMAMCSNRRSHPNLPLIYPSILQECEMPIGDRLQSSWRRIVLCGLFVAGLMAVAPFAQAEDEPGFKSIFDGKTLENWDGNPKFWSVQDGLLTGQTTAENPTNGNTFIIWRGGEPGDFELRLEYKIEGGNSGVQYRSF